MITEKILNTGEALAILENNPYRRFALKESAAIKLETNDDGDVIIDFDYFNINDQWVEIESKPVNFITAVEKGLVFRVVHKTIPDNIQKEIDNYMDLKTLFYSLLGNINNVELIEIIKEGQWFVR